MCGTPDFVENFMIEAENMSMTNPNEYVYLYALHNADTNELKLPNTNQRTVRAFKPVLKVP